MLGMVFMPNGTVGVEGAGIVVRTAARTGHSFQSGDRVFGWIGADFGAHNVPFADRMLRAPPKMQPEEVATMYTAWTTVDHALGALSGCVACGDIALVHGATGGVGIAALHHLHARGVLIVPTAGSDRKRAWLRQHACFHVSTTRDAKIFLNDLLSWFGPGAQSFSTVLNALSNEYILAAFDWSKAGGQMIEIGKRNIWSLQQATLRRSDVAYLPVDETVTNQHIAQVHESVERRAYICEYEPIPLVAFVAQACSEAFQFLRAAKHIGKVHHIP